MLLVCVILIAVVACVKKMRVCLGFVLCVLLCFVCLCVCCCVLSVIDGSRVLFCFVNVFVLCDSFFLMYMCYEAVLWFVCFFYNVYVLLSFCCCFVVVLAACVALLLFCLCG